MTKPFSIFMGYDPREHAVYEVACQSIIRRSSQPVLITPLYLPHLTHFLQRYIQRSDDGHLWCPISGAAMSTEFAISRFCVPFIQETGWALYADCDVLCLADIAELYALADEQYAVMVVKHDHHPAETVKMDDQEQSVYPRKNWSSVVLWNCEHDAHRRLTRNRLNYWPGRDLHAFKWLKDDEIGGLGVDVEWNALVGVDTMYVSQGDADHPDGESRLTYGCGVFLMNVPVKMLHYTNGGPWIESWSGGPMDDVWLREKGENHDGEDGTDQAMGREDRADSEKDCTSWREDRISQAPA